MKTKQRLMEIVPELDQVDSYTVDLFSLGVQKLADIHALILKMQGKKLRPALFLASARFHWDNMQKLIPVAVGLELAHTATLIHDDVLDHARMRRNVPTVNVLMGNHMAILLGDYLFTKAFTLITAYGSMEITDLFANLVERTAIGEICQQLDAFNVSLSEQEYLDRIEQKTATFIASCCLAGCLTAPASEQTKEAFHQFGLNLGMAFQIIDDVLDYTSREKKIGKDLHSDLQNGVLTLPLLYTLQCSKKGKEIGELILEKKLGEKDLLFLVKEIKAAGGLQYSIDAAESYIQKAYYYLEYIPSLRVVSGLRAIAEYVVSRVLPLDSRMIASV